MGESSNCVHSMKDFELKSGSSARSSSSSMGALASCGTLGDSILGVKLWEPIFGSSALFLSFTRLWASSSGVSSNSINSMQNWESISGSSAKLISSNMRSFLTGGTPGDCIITVNVGNFIFGNLAPFVSVGKLSAPSSGVSNNCINSEKLWDSVSGSKSESILSSVSSLGSSGILASSAEHFLLELSRPPFVKGVLQAPHLYRVVRRCHYWSTGTWRFRISRNVGSDTKRLHYLGVVPRMQPQSSRSLEDVSSFVRRDCEWNICGTPKHLYLGCSMFLLLRNLYSASVELQNGHVLVTPTYMAGSTALLGLPILAAKFLVMMFGRLRNYQGRETIANISLIKECTSLNSKFALIVASVSSFRAFW